MGRYDANQLKDVYLEIAKGNIPNHERATLTGHNPNITTTEETVWAEGGDVPLPLDVATTMTVSSDNANDTFGGSGMTLLLVNGIDGNNKRTSEVVVMNGLTGVSTVNSYRHINTLIQAGSGSTMFNEGIIYIGTGLVTSGKPALVYNLIISTDGASRVGYLLLSDDVYMTIVATNTSLAANKIGTTRFCVHGPSGRICNVESHLQDIAGTGLPPSRPVPPGSFVELRSNIDVGSGEISINIGVILIHESEFNT